MKELVCTCPARRQGLLGISIRSKVVALLALTCLTVVMWVQPAAASHLTRHWGDGFQPKVTVPDSSLWGYTGTAERTWAGNGFRNGFCVGPCAPLAGGCNDTFASGFIKVCFQAGEIIRRDCGSAAIACTFYQYVRNPNPHIDARYINICSDCGLSGVREQDAVTHEYGHAIGFDHSPDRGCVMYGASVTDVPCPDEVNGLQSTYNGHRER